MLTPFWNNIHLACARVYKQSLTLIVLLFIYFDTVSENLRNTCPEPNIENGIRSGADFNFGAEVTFKCNKNYYIVGDDRRICLECGRWSGKKAICQRKHLPPWLARASTTRAPYVVTGFTEILNTYPTQSTPRLTLGNEVPNPTQPWPFAELRIVYKTFWKYAVKGVSVVTIWNWLIWMHTSTAKTIYTLLGQF